MIQSPYDAAHYAKKAFEQDFEVCSVYIKAYAEHAGMGVSLMFERYMGMGRGRDSRGFTLVNYGRLDSLDTRLSIGKEAYRTMRKLAGEKDLGPDAMPYPTVLEWVNRVCDDLCR